MGQYNIENMPPNDAADEVPVADGSYRAFPAPLSACGVLCRAKSAFGLARGMLVDTGNFTCGSRNNRPVNYTYTALIDATCSGAYDSGDEPPDPTIYKVIRLSENRRSNLASSLMLMPPYFLRRARERYDYSFSSTWKYYSKVEEAHPDVSYLLTGQDWTIDSHVPPHGPLEPDGTSTYSVEGVATIRIGAEDSWQWPKSFLHTYEVRDPLDLSVVGTFNGYVVDTSNGNEQEYLDAVAKLLLEEYAEERRSWSIYARGGASGIERDLSPPWREELAFGAQHAPWHAIQGTSTRSFEAQPIENAVVSQEDFSDGFVNIDADGESSIVKFDPCFKWYAHVFAPETDFLWVRHRPAYMDEGW